jgi:hypothetical protein
MEVSMSAFGRVMETQEPHATLHAYLADFTVNQADLKETHKDFLEKVFRAIAVNPGATGFDGWIVTLWGKTSRTGSAELNRALAGRRTKAARDYLEDRLRTLPPYRVNFVEFPWEEEMAGPDDGVESEFHRSIEIWLTKTPFPKPKKKLVIALPFSKRFSIRLLHERDISQLPPLSKITKWLSRLKWVKRLPKVFISVEIMFFQIRDLEYGNSAIYVYDGIGIGGGLSHGTDRGDWNDFSTSKPIHVSEFGGFARFTGLGAGPKSKNYIYIDMPSGYDPVYMPINTGFTRGVAGSTTVGELTLIHEMR